MAGNSHRTVTVAMAMTLPIPLSALHVYTPASSAVAMVMNKLVGVNVTLGELPSIGAPLCNHDNCGCGFPVATHVRLAE